MIRVYGLRNCDTCRKALKWLDAEGMAYDFHDVRKDGLNADDVLDWLKKTGPEILVNRRGTTWRNLSETEKLVSSDQELVTLLLANPAVIKRPVFVKGDAVIVGFKDEQKVALQA